MVLLLLLGNGEICAQHIKEKGGGRARAAKCRRLRATFGPRFFFPKPLMQKKLNSISCHVATNGGSHIFTARGP